MYIEFKKEHPVGIKKGQCRSVDETTAIEFISEGYADEVDEDTYQDFVSSLRDKDISDAKKKMANAVKSNKKRSETVPSDNEEGELTKGKKKRYHKLTSSDIEVNKGYSDGFEEGEEVLLDENGDLAVGNDNKFIRKGND